MPAIRKKRREIRVHELTERQFWALALGGDDEAFASEDERRELYFRHRDELTTNPTTRADGWWLYESLEPRNEAEQEHEQLERMGCLTPEERGHLAQWRAAGIFAERNMNR